MVGKSLESNLLVRMGVTHKEDIVSNVLADLLNEPSFLDRWLAFAGLPPVGGRKVDVRTRIKADGNIPDLAVLAGDATSGSLLVIENKILATEGEAQTERYSKPETIEALGKSFGIDGMTKDRFHGLYLSLHDEGPKDEFQNIRYENITAWLRELAMHTPDSTRKLLAMDLAELIEYFHLEEWTSNDGLLDVLKRDPYKLGKNFVAFQNIFLEATRDLSKSDLGVRRDFFFWRGSGHGHGYFGGRIDTDCAESGWYLTLDGTEGKKLWSTTHIEFQFAPATGNMKLALHFETSPYKPKKQQEALFQGREHLNEKHAHARGKIIEALKAGLPDGWRPDNNLLQIAYANLEVKPETSIAEFQNQVRSLVHSMIPVLDNAWKEVPR